MTIAGTILFFGLVALAHWLEDLRLHMMAGLIGLAAGLAAMELAPAPWVGLMVFGIGVQQVVFVVRTMWTARRHWEDER